MQLMLPLNRMQNELEAYVYCVFFLQHFISFPFNSESSRRVNCGTLKSTTGAGMKAGDCHANDIVVRYKQVNVLTKAQQDDTTPAVDLKYAKVI